MPSLGQECLPAAMPADKKALHVGKEEHQQ